MHFRQTFVSDTLNSFHSVRVFTRMLFIPVQGNNEYQGLHPGPRLDTAMTSPRLDTAMITSVLFFVSEKYIGVNFDFCTIALFMDRTTSRK